MVGRASAIRLFRAVLDKRVEFSFQIGERRASSCCRVCFCVRLTQIDAVVGLARQPSAKQIVPGCDRVDDSPFPSELRHESRVRDGERGVSELESLGQARDIGSDVAGGARVRVKLQVRLDAANDEHLAVHFELIRAVTWAMHPIYHRNVHGRRAGPWT